MQVVPHTPQSALACGISGPNYNFPRSQGGNKTSKDIAWEGNLKELLPAEI